MRGCPPVAQMAPSSLGETFGAHESRHNGNAGMGKGFEQFHADAGAPLRDGTDEYGVLRQRGADVIHISQHFEIGGGIGIGVRRRRVGARDDQLGCRFLFENVGQDFADEPIDRDAVGVVTETADEQHGERLAAGRAELGANLDVSMPARRPARRWRSGRKLSR